MDPEGEQKAMSSAVDQSVGFNTSRRILSTA
jgi:hypothetical protein